jgi:hypothetical protein
MKLTFSLKKLTLALVAAIASTIPLPTVQAAEGSQYLIAKETSGKKTREKHIVREGASKKGSSNYIDFEKADISGQRKTPLGSMINQGVSDKNYDFIKIRFDWHGEMVQSAKSLEASK